MTAVAPQNRGDNMGRYSVAGSGLDCKSSGFTSPGSSPGRLTTVVSTAWHRCSGNQSGPGNQYVSPWDNKITEETTAPQLVDWPRGANPTRFLRYGRKRRPRQGTPGKAEQDVTAGVWRPFLTNEVKANR